MIAQLTESLMDLMQKVDPAFGALAGFVTFMSLTIGFIAWHQSERRDIKNLWKFVLIAGGCAVAIVALFGLLLVYARSRSVVLPMG